jgi:hypothetical protein
MKSNYGLKLFTCSASGGCPNTSDRFTGKRSSTRESGSNDDSGDARGAEKRAHSSGRSSYSSAYDLPESIPAYVLQFTSSSMQDTIAKTVSSMHTSSNSMMQYERKRMYEAESECKRLEAVVNELRRSKVSCQLQLKYECFE